MAFCGRSYLVVSQRGLHAHERVDEGLDGVLLEVARPLQTQRIGPRATDLLAIQQVGTCVPELAAELQHNTQRQRH